MSSRSLRASATLFYLGQSRSLRGLSALGVAALLANGLIADQTSLGPDLATATFALLLLALPSWRPASVMVPEATAGRFPESPTQRR